MNKILELWVQMNRYQSRLRNLMWRSSSDYVGECKVIVSMV